MDLRKASTAHDFDTARALFRQYVQIPGVLVCAAGFERELAALESFYEVILLAFDGPRALGCGALRPLHDGSAEIKRLFVQPEARGLNAGRSLAVALIGHARRAGYSAVRLDTLPSMRTAIALYESLGFQRIPPYHPSCVDNSFCYELRLTPPPA
ncbi:MAG: GNAT family N-acetyltransferase [Candidatus Solibacter usitatus]|nr:GNAT family N-acetyltransferase [Candidatus Solibacter usitatus]